MNDRLIRINLAIFIGLAIVGGVIWAGFTYVYQGVLNVTTNGQTATVTVINAQNQQVAKGQNTLFRLIPGTYTVAVVGDTSGISKQVTISSLTTTTITLGSGQVMQASPIASVPLYGAFSSGDSVIGLDPTDMHVKRIDRQGTVTDQLTSGQLANQSNWEAELPNEVQSYQPYQHGQALVASGGVLYLVSSTAVHEISTDGITIDHTTAVPPQFIIAAQPGTASFVVAYKQDVYIYDSPNSKPKKIYTSQKTFDSVAYGNGRVALYFAAMPDSQQDLRSQYSNYLIDPLFIDSAHNNQTQTVPGPATHIAISPDGQQAVIQPRHQQSYLYDLQKQQDLTYIDMPMIGWPLWINNTTYVYTKQNKVWQYYTANRQSTLLGTVPYDATSVYRDDSGSYIVTMYGGLQQAGVYRLGATVSSPASSQNTSLSNLLPYDNGLFSITYSNVTAPTIVIHTMAPLNNADELTRYKQQTLQLRQQALDYLNQHKIDLKGITVTYDPADPL